MNQKYNAIQLLRDACERRNIRLNVLIADTGLWAHPKVHQYLLEENGTGAFFPNTCRYRTGNGEHRGQIIDGVRLDDNSYANHAIKQALGLGRNGADGFEVCHIWPGSAYDPNCHTVLANLLLLPRPLASLTDHDSDIQATLKYRAFELYGWHPVGETSPAKPFFYPEEWREPLPFDDVVLRALKRRKQTYITSIEAKQEKS